MIRPDARPLKSSTFQIPLLIFISLLILNMSAFAHGPFSIDFHKMSTPVNQTPIEGCESFVEKLSEIDAGFFLDQSHPDLLYR